MLQGRVRARRHYNRWRTRSVLAGAIATLGGLMALAGVVHGGSGTPTSALASTALATPTAAPALASPDGPIPAAIRTTVRRGPLSVTLTVAPLQVGPARFVATVRERGHLVTAGRVSLQLSMPAQPVVGVATLALAPCANGYCGGGNLQGLGRWHAVVRVGLPVSSGWAGAVPFDFLNGAGARYLFAQAPDTRFGPATVRVVPGAHGSYRLTVRLRPGLAVRATLDMPGMRSMGTTVERAVALSRDEYAVPLSFPMTGVSEVVLAVRTGSRWQPVRTLLYDVDSFGRASPLTNTPT